MDWEYSRESWRPARPSFMDIGDSTTRDFAQNPPLEKYRGKWENGRTKISGGFWGVDFSWTSGEDPRSIGAILAALSPKMALNWQIPAARSSRVAQTTPLIRQFRDCVFSLDSTPEVCGGPMGDYYCLGGPPGAEIGVLREAVDLPFWRFSGTRSSPERFFIQRSRNIYIFR